MMHGAGRRSRLGAALALAAVLGAGPSQAAMIQVAVAANFAKAAGDIAAGFKKKSGTDVLLSLGATGALYTQITQGAPFEVFLSADDKRTRAAIEEGLAVEGTDFTYAVGRLVLYSPKIDVTDGAAVLRAGGFQHIAIAEPKTAPYGAAGMAVLDALGLTDAMTPKIVTGENITQTQQFVESGSAELGFVALSQVVGKPASQVWPVPQEDYPAIRQNAVLLKAGADDELAKAFLGYLKSDEAATLIKAAGYGLE